MSDFHNFPGGYEEESHDRALFGILGGSDKVHIHFYANGDAPARDVWEKHNQLLGGLLGQSHDLHVHQDAGRYGGETDIRVHDGAVLGGLIIDDHRADFKTQRFTPNGVETRETQESSGSSMGGIVAAGHSCTEKTSIQGADGVTRTQTRHENGGTILGGIIGASQETCRSNQVTTPDGVTRTTYYKNESSGEALAGVAAEGRSTTEYVDNGQGPIGMHTYRGTVLGGVIYGGEHIGVMGADLPGAQNYLDLPTPYASERQAIPANQPVDVSESSYAPAAPPAAADGQSSLSSPSLSPQTDAPLYTASTGGDLSGDGAPGRARRQEVQNFIDPDTHRPIAKASVLRFDNGDYFLADGNNVRVIDAHNQRVNFVTEGSSAVAQGAKGDDMVLDPVTHKEVPRLQAKISDDGKGVQFDFFNGVEISADKDGNYKVHQSDSSDSAGSRSDSGDEGAPPPVPVPRVLSEGPAGTAAGK